MLTPPPDWPRVHGGFLARSLYSQIDRCSLRCTFAIAMVDAAIKLLQSTYRPRIETTSDATGVRPRTTTRLKVRRNDEFSWQVNELRYVHIPLLDDVMLDKYLNTCVDGVTMYFIAPLHQQFVLEHTLSLRADGLHLVTVCSFDFFFSWRVFTASMDAKITHEQSICRLLRYYNSNVSKSCVGNELLVNTQRRTS